MLSPLTAGRRPRERPLICPCLAAVPLIFLISPLLATMLGIHCRYLGLEVSTRGRHERLGQLPGILAADVITSIIPRGRSFGFNADSVPNNRRASRVRLRGTKLCPHIERRLPGTGRAVPHRPGKWGRQRRNASGLLCPPHFLISWTRLMCHWSQISTNLSRTSRAGPGDAFRLRHPSQENDLSISRERIRATNVQRWWARKYVPNRKSRAAAGEVPALVHGNYRQCPLDPDIRRASRALGYW